MTDTAIAIIQARMSSSRLPGKVLKPLAGRPMISHVVERAQSCKYVDQVVVATSVESSDDPLADYCLQFGIPCYRGSLENVLSRYLEVLMNHPHRYYVRITADCPLIHPDFIDRQIEGLVAHDGDQIYLVPSVPVLGGQGVHSVRSLRKIAVRSCHPDDLEHVGSRYQAEHPEQFRIIGLTPPEEWIEPNWRVTVDEINDYMMMRALYAALWRGQPIALTEALAWMAQHSELASINQSVPHSAINKELSAKQISWMEHVALFCDWNDPRLIEC
jgi:spore coat polysaccharide biosynthesis protein SpsF